ncbi:acyloxyacyl hydrolase [Pigmentiphaga soli]|uniref:Lipid A deacylase n=1 Tax=Pigmentiphaga soli TaxID=1007095 RepID=A0ABP8GR58_9BURK
MKKLGVLAGLLALSFQAHAAEPQGWDNGGWTLHLGTGEASQRITVNRETAPLWQHRFSGSRIELVGELGLSYWWTTQDVQAGYSSHNWQLSAIPLFRWWPGDRFYIEGGVGATAFSERRFHDKNISTTFQFGDHIGAGYQLDRTTRVGLRISHFSNAGIKHPNPGMNVVQLTLGKAF